MPLAVEFRDQRRWVPDLAALMTVRNGEVAAWARTIRDLEVETVNAFFNNDDQGHSPASARPLQALLGLDPVDPSDLSPQQELFG